MTKSSFEFIRIEFSTFKFDERAFVQISSAFD